MTEQDLTALAKEITELAKAKEFADDQLVVPITQLAQACLALLAERDGDKIVLAEERQINVDNRRQIRGLQARCTQVEAERDALQAQLDTLTTLWEEAERLDSLRYHPYTDDECDAAALKVYEAVGLLRARVTGPR